jgi:hypothetical protein
MFCNDQKLSIFMDLKKLEVAKSKTPHTVSSPSPYDKVNIVSSHFEGN